ELLFNDLDKRYQTIWQSKARRNKVGLGIHDINERLSRINENIDNIYDISEFEDEEDWEKKHELMKILRYGFNSSKSRNKYDELTKIDQSLFCDLIDEGIIDPLKVTK